MDHERRAQDIVDHLRTVAAEYLEFEHDTEAAWASDAADEIENMRKALDICMAWIVKEYRSPLWQDPLDVPAEIAHLFEASDDRRA